MTASLSFMSVGGSSSEYLALMHHDHAFTVFHNNVHVVFDQQETVPVLLEGMNSVE